MAIQPIPLVPFDTWDFEIATLNEEGSEADLSDWTILEREVVTAGKTPFNVEVSFEPGKAIVHADAEVTNINLGAVNKLTIRVQSPSGTETTLIVRKINGVEQRVIAGTSVQFLGLQGPAGPSQYDLYVVHGGLLTEEEWLASQEESRLAAEEAAEATAADRTAVAINTALAQAARDAVNGLGLYRPTPDSVFLLPGAAYDQDNPEHHGVLFTERGSLSIGGRTTDGDNRLPNQSALEVCISNNGSSGVPATLAEWNAVGAAVEPVIFYRSRGAEIGDSGVVLAGDGVLTLQGQVDDGLDTPNVGIGSISMSVPSGVIITPSPGNVRTVPGRITMALSPGDGINPIRTTLELQSDGDINAVAGSVLINNTAVINQARWSKFAARLADPRAAVANDAIYTLPIPGGVTAIVRMIATALAATTPAVMFACRTDSAACELMSISAAAEAAVNVVAATASGVVSDVSGYAVGKLIIVASNNGNVYIVNRLGASKTYGFHIEINGSTL